jgi:hypothetical protein
LLCGSRNNRRGKTADRRNDRYNSWSHFPLPNLSVLSRVVAAHATCTTAYLTALIGCDERAFYTHSLKPNGARCSAVRDCGESGVVYPSMGGTELSKYMISAPPHHRLIVW